MNIRRYLAYFLCISFSVMAFFMYTTIMFNQQLMNAFDTDAGSNGIINVSIAVLAVFSLLFITYGHSTFIKSRRKEFGLLLTLGMSRAEIGKIISIENGLVGLFSILLGLVGGTVFSRLFYMAFVHVLGLQGIIYRLDIKSYVLTVVMFAAVFAMVIAVSCTSTGRMEITELLKNSRKMERNRINSPLLGLAGIFMIVFPIVAILKRPPTDGSGQDLFYLILLCLIGLYLLISHFGSMVIRLVKKNRKIYYRQLLLTSGINYRFNRNKRIIYIISVLCIATIFYMGIFYTIYSGALEQSSEQHPYHVAYVEYKDYNRLTGETRKELLAQGDNPLVSEKQAEFLRIRFGFPAFTYSESGPAVDVQKPTNTDVSSFHEGDALSVSQYNEFAESKLHVEEGHFINLRLTAAGKEKSSDFPFPLVYIASGKGVNSFIYDKTICDMPFNKPPFLCESVKLLNDSDYERLRTESDKSSIGTIYLMNFKNWEKTGSIADSLKQALNEANAFLDTTAPYNKTISMAKALEPVSRLEYFTELKQGAGTALYLFGFIGFIFFVSSGCVLYFKLYTELDSMKDRFRKLFNVGITGGEVKKLVINELKLVFFFPLILGSIISCFLIYSLSADDSARTEQYLAGALIISGVYFLFQSLYYAIIRQKYLDEILK
jgi:ABC-type antimicrobial peptide transport system permease subunit